MVTYPRKGVFLFIRRLLMKTQWKIILILVLAILVAGGTKIFAQEQTPIVSLACEGKSGQLTGVGDGWSNKSDCKGDNQRLVRLGNEGPNGTGNILFIYKPTGDTIFALTADGKIYRQTNNGPWSQVLPNDFTYPDSLPAGLLPTEVAQWMIGSVLGKDGNVYWYDRTSHAWANVGHP
jgi:hypothetical protein